LKVGTASVYPNEEIKFQVSLLQLKLGEVCFPRIGNEVFLKEFCWHN